MFGAKNKARAVHKTNFAELFSSFVKKVNRLAKQVAVSCGPFWLAYVREANELVHFSTKLDLKGFPLTRRVYENEEGSRATVDYPDSWHNASTRTKSFGIKILSLDDRICNVPR